MTFLLSRRSFGSLGRALHHRGLRRFGAQAQRRHHVGADVDGEDLQHGERRGDQAAGEQIEGGGHRLRGIGIEDIAQELADVVVDGAALLDGLDDGGKVVIAEDHIRRLLGHIGAGNAHAMPISAFLRAGESLTPSPVTATILPISWRAVTIRYFCSGAIRAKTTSPFSASLEGGIVHRGQLGPGDDPGVRTLDDADLAGDALGSKAIVTGDHNDLDAGGTADGHRIPDLGTGRVLHGHQAEEGELLLDNLRGVLPDGGGQGGVLLGQRPVGKASTRRPSRA